MKIEDLKEDYPLIYEAALKNRPNVTDRSIVESFDWNETPEGYYFWSAIYAKNFAEAKQIYPHLFESKNEFKEDDYIVLLNTPIADREFPRNYIFKQRANISFLLTELDATGSTTNGWKQVRFDGSRHFSKWRYATQEEIKEYDRLGKPYDVTNLTNKPQFEVGQYLPGNHPDKQSNKNKKVLGKFDIGDIVVSLATRLNRNEGDIFKVMPKSNNDCLHYKSRKFRSCIPSPKIMEWRLATSEEKAAYEKGITNTKYVKKEANMYNELNVEVGDIVECINTTSDSAVPPPKGAGYQEGLQFKVTSISKYPYYNLYFGGKGGAGVYSTSVRTVGGVCPVDSVKTPSSTTTPKFKKVVSLPKNRKLKRVKLFNV